MSKSWIFSPVNSSLLYYPIIQSARIIYAHIRRKIKFAQILQYQIYSDVIGLMQVTRFASPSVFIEALTQIKYLKKTKLHLLGVHFLFLETCQNVPCVICDQDVKTSTKHSVFFCRPLQYTHIAAVQYHFIKLLCQFSLSNPPPHFFGVSKA